MNLLHDKTYSNKTPQGVMKCPKAAVERMREMGLDLDEMSIQYWAFLCTVDDTLVNGTFSKGISGKEKANITERLEFDAEEIFRIVEEIGKQP